MLINRNYIARKYIEPESGGKHLYEEGSFSSYESAYEFIQEISEEDEDCFSSEIVSYVIDSHEPWEQEKHWIFDRKGNLLHKFTSDNKHTCTNNIYTGQFNVGDLVFIKAFPWNTYSYRSTDIIGVVVTCPVSHECWVSNGNDKDEWNSEYVIDFIRSGYLDHIHIKEQGIEKFHGILPQEHTFLRCLSKHYQGYKVFKNGIAEQIINGKMFIGNVPLFSEDDLIKT